MDDLEDDWPERWHRSVERNADVHRELAARIAAIEASASDAARVVTVTVDSSGVLTALSLGRTAGNRVPGDLAALIMETMRTAQAKLAPLAAAAAGEITGLDDDVASSVVDAFARRFPCEERNRRR